MGKRILIVGGVAAGASAAARARRMDDEAEIVIFERGDYVSFANCGLPYYVGGEIKAREDLLLVSPELFRDRFHIDVRLRHLVTAIDRAGKTVAVQHGGETSREHYDKLILAPGCTPARPPVPGAQLGGVHTVFTVNDVDTVMGELRGGVKDAVVLGGGFIGLETAEGLARRGIRTTVVEMLDRLMPIFDPEFSLPMERHLADAGIRVLLKTSVKAIEGETHVQGVVLSDGSTLPADLVILAAGLRPNTELARDAGLRIGVTGGIEVDDAMHTSDPDIFAAGDAAETRHAVTGKPIRVSLATNANRQGRIAGTNAAGGDLHDRGTLATSVIRICDLTAARTGVSEREARDCGLDCFSVYVPDSGHAAYFPGAGWLILKITAARGDGRILGAQAVGDRGVDKRIDVLATAIRGGLSVYDLEHLDLCYAPPYSSAKGPEILGGMIASDLLRGETKLVEPAQLTDFLRETGAELIDVRERAEWDAGHIEGARLIPLPTLRADPALLDPAKKYVVYCGVGKRAHTACRFLTQKGYDVWNLTGGYNAWVMDV